MRKGIVLELERKHAVVLTRDGQFVRVPMRKQQWSVGEEVSVPAPRRLRRTVVAIASVCAAAVLFLLAMMPGFGGFGGQSAVAAYITLDINPSVELALNASDLVIAAKGLDEDGGALLSELALAGLPLETAANLVVEQAFRMNMLSSDGDSGAGTILITGTVVDERNKEKETVLLERVTATVKEAMTDNHPTEAERIAVESLAAPVELREAAAQAGVSPGQLAIRLLAEELIAELPDDNQLVPSSVSEIARSVGGIGKLIQEAKARDTDGWKQLLDAYKQRHAEEQELAVQDEGKQDNRDRKEDRRKDEDRVDNKGNGKANGNRNNDKGSGGKDKGGGKDNGNGNKNGNKNGKGNGNGNNNGNGNGNVQKSGGSLGGHDGKNSQAAQIYLRLDTIGSWFNTVEKGLTFPDGTAKVEAQSNRKQNVDERSGDDKRKDDARGEGRGRGIEKKWQKDRNNAKNGSRDKESGSEKERSRNDRENGTSKKNDRKSQAENGNAGKKTAEQAEKNRKKGDLGKEKKKRDGSDD
jgi:hypothetical protein